MSDENQLIETAYVEHMSDHFRRASEELLYAYQSNKEAARHHQSGAFKLLCTTPNCPSTTASMRMST